MRRHLNIHKLHVHARTHRFHIKSTYWVKLLSLRLKIKHDLHIIHTWEFALMWQTRVRANGSHPQQWSTLKWHICLREITLLQLQLLPALTGESADAPQLDYLWLATLYLFVISLCLHSATSFWLAFISVWLGDFYGMVDVVVLHGGLCKPRTSARLVSSLFIYCIRNNILNTFQMLGDNNFNTFNRFIHWTM